MAAKDGSVSFDLWGTFDEIQENSILSYTLGDERKVRVTFQDEGEHVLVTEVFCSGTCTFRRHAESGLASNS